MLTNWFFSPHSPHSPPLFMPLLQIDNVTMAFRGPPLLDAVACSIEPGERISLVGRNGCGKTTLLRIIAGQQVPDHGVVRLASGASLAYLPQDVPADLSGSVRSCVAAGAPEGLDDWQFEQQLTPLLSDMQLAADAEVATMSSGTKRRVLLARALIGRPDVLLLDEPTNHLDIDSIGWLEDYLLRWPGTLVFVTHDRAFLRRLATRILEIDRGHLFDWECDYATFLSRKEAALSAEEKQNALFDKRLAQEEAWIRQGIKARRTRNEGRVRALKAMRNDRAARRERQGTAKLDIQTASRSGQLVIEATDLSFAYGDRQICRDFSTTIMRGDKIGIVGPNGAGKTTLLRLLLGQLAPQSGRVRLGTNLQIAYFDQLRDTLDADASVEQNVGEGNSTVEIGGRSRHVLGYLQDFLFSPDRARTLVKFLSGGERNRVLLAKLFAKPANLLVLDEPTNDLDAETLELLEAQLVDYDGSVIVVSHDREFLNNLTSSLLVFEPEGLREYVGGYDDWLAQRAREVATAVADKPTANKAANETKSVKRPAKLSYKQQRELDGLPAKIEQIEAEVAQLHQLMATPEFYSRPGDEIAEVSAKSAQLDTLLRESYARWEELLSSET
jgi:ATP-binding cassette subfamily F protein uup